MGKLWSRPTSEIREAAVRVPEERQLPEQVVLVLLTAT